VGSTVWTGLVWTGGAGSWTVTVVFCCSVNVESGQVIQGALPVSKPPLAASERWASTSSISTVGESGVG
jgi:hypothetical protein